MGNSLRSAGLRQTAGSECNISTTSGEARTPPPPIPRFLRKEAPMPAGSHVQKRPNLVREGEQTMRIRQASRSATVLDREGNLIGGSATILVVDDDNDVRALLSELFTRAGFDVIEASNGLEGLQLLSTECIDLVVTDVSMPVKDGLSMIAEARDLAPRVRFIVHSGSDLETLERARSLSSGSILTVLSKPMSFFAIVAAVRDALRGCGNGCPIHARQTTRSGGATIYTNPLFGAVRELLYCRECQAPCLDGGEVELQPPVDIR